MMRPPIYRLDAMSKNDLERILRRSEAQISSLTEEVRPVVETVASRGDSALFHFTEIFDKIKLEPDKLEVKKEDISDAYRRVDAKLVNALKLASRNITAFHEAQMPRKLWFTRIAKGVKAGMMAVPLKRVGLYVPAGKGSFPSVALMLATPAKVAGVEEVIMCMPPVNGVGDPATLVAADIAGVNRIFRVGGAQAIAAMAYGTESIPRVEKLMGPGSGYVYAAKRLVRDVVAQGTPSGPSEVCVLTDETTLPEVAAMEAIVEAEHGSDSSSVVVVTSDLQAKLIADEISKILIQLPDWRRKFAESAFCNYGGIVVTKNLAAAIDLVNDYAPEHLVVLTSKPNQILMRIRNAGSVFLGVFSSVAAGSYITGPNAVLPTGGHAKTHSATTVFDFMKLVNVEQVTRQGLAALQPAVEALAEYEGFPAHALAVKKRLRMIT